MSAIVLTERITLGIDPGNIETAYCLLQTDGRIIKFGKVPNAEFSKYLLHTLPYSEVACEMICSYGMPAGASLFDTCVFIGEIKGNARWPVVLIPRIQVKSHVCHSGRATDSNVRQAMIDKYGPQGTKKNPGPTYGITADVWSALAIADTFQSGDFTPYVLSSEKPESKV